MDKGMKIVLAILAVSLLLNIRTYMEVSDLNYRLNDLTQNRTTIIDEMNDMREMINEIKEQQQWITPVQIEPGALVDGKQNVRFSWQIKDYPLGSPVSFCYRQVGNQEFQEIAAISQTGGNFEVEVGIEQEDQPSWSVEYKDKVLSKYGEQSASSTYEYYITLKEGARLKSSEMDRVNLEKLGKKYASLEVTVVPERTNNEFEIMLYLEKHGMMPEKTYLEVYKGNQLVETKELKDREEEANEKIISWQGGEKQFDRLLLSVEYENHKVFKKEIWNKEISERS